MFESVPLNEMSTHEQQQNPQIHPTATVDEGAMLGLGTKVWHFCHISSKAVLGENCVVGQNVFIDNDVVVGNGVKIQNNVSLYKGVIVKDHCFIGPSVVFTNVINPRSEVVRKEEFKTTLLERGVSIGANATIVCGITLGSYAFVAAGSVVTKDIKPYAMVMGVPAMQTGWMSAHGEKLEFNESGIAVCGGSGQQYQLAEGFVTAL